MYERLAPASGKPGLRTLVLTQAVSALWHVSYALTTTPFLSQHSSVSISFLKKTISQPGPSLCFFHLHACTTQSYARFIHTWFKSECTKKKRIWIFVERDLFWSTLGGWQWQGLHPGYFLFFLNCALAQHASKGDPPPTKKGSI